MKNDNDDANDNVPSQVDEHNTAKLHALSETTGTAIAMIRYVYSLLHSAQHKP